MRLRLFLVAARACAGGRALPALRVGRAPHADRLPGRSRACAGATTGSASSTRASRHTRASCGRPSTGRGSPQTKPANAREPVRPRLPLRRPRRVRPQRRPARDGGHADDLGHAELGERRQGPELRADAAWPTSELRARARRRGTRAGYSGYPFVSYYSVWNESNLGQFLSPQYDTRASRPRPRSTRSSTGPRTPGSRPATRARLSAIGETSARGRDHFLGKKGTQETRVAGQVRASCSRSSSRSSSSTPGRTTRTRRSINGKPLANVRWPNVTLAAAAALRGVVSTSGSAASDVPIWITEYGHETKPEEPKGVTLRAAGRLRRRRR